ncbi:DUF6221 family protein [Streptomyces cyaneofuscatus]|uniref:DUF6221 family protein n=1 Tax=Streptomyces cyaneofuscatus TaxID=66883 RepID=UPI0036E0F80F
MTAQGEDVLAYLDAAIARVETAARAVDYDTIETGDYLWGTKYLVLRRDDEAKAAPEMDAELADHIALHDPQSVLRRCAADRKLIAEHGPFSATDLSCKGCGLNGHEEMVTGYYEDCPVLCAIAEGYGRTEGER